MKFLHNCEWNFLSKKYSPQIVVSRLSYEESFSLARKIFVEAYRDDELMGYAIDLFFAIRSRYNEEWNSNWINDIYLSGLCSIIYRYEESYQLLKEAYDKSVDPSALLLYNLADCIHFPPECEFVSEDEAIGWYLQSAQKSMSQEAAIQLEWLYRRKGDIERSEEWGKKAREAEELNLHLESQIPNIFQS